ncbi:MAG: hypothetical protein Q9208_008235 [Pyrenodesmia sp. 3 TL-2023]
MMDALFRLTIFLLFTLATMQRIMAAPAPPSVPPLPALSAPPAAAAANWPGWGGIEKLFVFGASYTATGFHWLEEQPSPQHPLGNHLRGTTSSNGPNFITYLTTTFNASQILTYNFAYPGAQLDYDATAAHKTEPMPRNDMKAQVNHGFEPSYTRRLHPPYATWSGGSTLFISFFGINDIQAYYDRHHPFSPVAAAETTDRAMASYAARLDTLYRTGARNFLLVNSPPMDQMPFFTLNATRTGYGPDSLTPAIRAARRAAVKETVALWNARFPSLVAGFKQQHPDATLFWYDAHALFSDMLSQPAVTDGYTGTYGLRPITHLTRSCEWYTKLDGKGNDMYLGADDLDDPRCGGSVGSYFWLNGLHVTWPVHKVMAGRMAEGLRRGGAVGGRLR